MIAENTVSHGFETMACLDGCDTSGLGSGEYSGRYGLEGDCRENCICWQVGSLEELQNGKLNSIRPVILQEVWVVSENWTGVAVATTF